MLLFQEGYVQLTYLDRYFIGMGLMITLSCELIALVYVYGVFNISDDLEFVTDYYPSIYYQIVWLGTPVALLVNHCLYFFILKDEAL